MARYLSHEEHRSIARELEKHHAIFEAIWSLSRIRFSDKLPTAGVLFNKRGDCVDMILNPEFWNSLNFIKKCFVLSHECMHIALDHGSRAKDIRKTKRIARLINIAQDIVINHALVERYGFYRDDIDPILPLYDKKGNPIIDEKTGEHVEGRKYCWVDTIFPDVADMPTDENYEYYYVRLKEKSDRDQEKLEKLLENIQTVDDHEFNQENNEGMDGEPLEIPDADKFKQDMESHHSDESGGEGAEGESGTDGDGEGDGDADIDEFEYFDSEDYTEDFEDVIDKLDRDLSEKDKQKLQHFIEENENSNKPVEENPDFKPSETTNGDMGGKGRGTAAGKRWTFAKKMKIKKRKYESIITDWCKKKLREQEVEIDQWVWTNRRFAALNPGDMFLPSEYEVTDEDKENEKIDVWFFQDTSGSCGPYKDRFFAIIESMPMEKFNHRLFCFDTKIYETDLESRELKGFGGTAFNIIEEFIQKELAENDETKRYPDAVFVVTDGEGNTVVPEKPENWKWILTPDGTDKFVPDASEKYDLAKYE